MWSSLNQDTLPYGLVLLYLLGFYNTHRGHELLYYIIPAIRWPICPRLLCRFIFIFYLCVRLWRGVVAWGCGLGFGVLWLKGVECCGLECCGLELAQTHPAA